METLTLIQGTPEWHAHRAKSFNASDAPAMMGLSSYTTRDKLLRRLHTGITEEVDPETQRRFDRGHRFERLARPHAEEIIGESLFPVTGKKGRYSASFDGLTVLGDVAFEHKTLNATLRNAIQNGSTGDDLPAEYRLQMEQQCYVSGAERVLFVASEWAEKEDTCLEMRHCWYTPNPDTRKQLLAGWGQFAADLENYVEPAAAAPAPTGRAPDMLPALLLDVSGAVTASNLPEFREHALAVLGGINRTLTTDEDFADAEKTVKWCADVESRIEAAKEHALAQTSSIEDAFRVLDDIKAEARRVRLDLDKLVKAEKENRKGAIVRQAREQLEIHYTKLNERVDGLLRHEPADFAGVIKGLKSLASIQSAVNDTLAAAKIAANEVADSIQTNLKVLEHFGYDSLFPDRATLVLKAPDDLRDTIVARIAKDKQERAEREAKEQQAAQAAAAPIAAPAQPPERAELDADPRFAAVVAGALPVTMEPAPQPSRDGPPTLKLGDLNARIAPIQITTDGLRSLGFEPAGHDRRAVLYHEADFEPICRALIEHLSELCAVTA